MSPVSAEKHRESLAHLRRLSAELRQLRSREVQAALEHTPLEGADVEDDEVSINKDVSEASLRAKMFSMKAELASLRKELEESRNSLRKTALKEETVKRDLQERIRKLELDNHEKDEACKNLEMACSGLRHDKERLETDVRQKDGYLREAGSREQRLLGDLKESMEKELQEARRLAEKGAMYQSEYDNLVSSREMEKRIWAREKELSQARNTSLESELSAERDARKSLERELAVSNSEGIDQVQLLHSKITRLSTDKSALVDENERLRCERSSLTETLRHLEREKVKSESSNSELQSLKETVAKLKRDAKGVSEAKLIIESLTAEKAKVSKLIASLTPNKDLTSGYEILRNATESPSPSAAILNASSAQLLQQRTKSHRQEMATLNSKVSALSTRLNSQRDANRSLQNKCALLNTKVAAKEGELARLKDLLTIVEVERAGLRNILQTVQNSLGSATLSSNSQKDSVKQQLALASASVNKYKEAARRASEGVSKRDEQISSLTARLSALEESQGVGAGVDEVAVLRGRLVEAVKAAAEEKSEREKVEEKRRGLERELSVLTGELEQLGKVKEGLKVLHLKNNPYSEARLNQIQQEAGRKRRKRYSENDIDDEDGMRKRILELEKKEKLAERYKEIAKRKIEELRVACYSIFGWDIRVHGANYTVSSMYAESEEEKLVFSDQGGGVMSLIENDYCGAIRPKIDQYLTQCHSIPALLAEITFENFEKTTLMPS